MGGTSAQENRVHTEARSGQFSVGTAYTSSQNTRQ